MKIRKLFVIPILLSFFCYNQITIAEHNDNVDFYNQSAVEASTSTIEKTVIPGGKSIGITLSSDGIIVCGITEIKGTNGYEHSPAKDAGMKIGDIIHTFNNKKITQVSELSEAVTKNGDKPASVGFTRKGKAITSNITPQKSAEDNTYKLGIWIKDAASGIGTLTFYDPETKYFAALGHGIYNSDSEEILKADGGEMLNSVIVDVEKSKKGSPGELKGIFSESGEVLGTIKSNNNFGICGEISGEFTLSNAPVTVAPKEDIKIGNAYILSNIEGEKIEKFSIEIQKISSSSNNNSKDMIIKITDNNLISKTGGIVQGMSGSPIIQNGKIVGAVTHVFVNDPTRGYGIFIKNMLGDVN